MGSYSGGFHESFDGFEFTSDFDDLPGSNQPLRLSDGFYLDDPFLNFAPLDHSETYPYESNEALSIDPLSSPSDDVDFSDSVLKYISQVLMEEDMEEKPCMFHDALALQAAEKSLYEALGEKHPSASSSMDHHGASFYPEILAHDNSSDGSFSGGGFSDYTTTTTTTTSSDSHLRSKENGSEVFVKTENHSSAPLPSNRLTGKKSHWRDEDEDLDEERSNKQSAVYVEETELSEMFDKILLCGTGQPVCIIDQKFPKEPTKVETAQQISAQSNGAKTRGGKKSNVNTNSNGSDSKKETADLRTLLVLCAQAVSVDDRRTANEMLRQIRENSSPLGNGSERLAHYFANSLEARLAGTGTQIYTALSSKKTSAADMLKAYQTYISVCPFKKAAIIFANHSIMRFTANENMVHIIDFGISYGFQWPALIYRLSFRPGGPPKLRITGIELPQRGFRPAEGVQETGNRLARYCQRYNVPFEYNAIAQKWETIKVEDFKIQQGEFVVVNSLFRFKNLLDETVVDCPRDGFLKLIRDINPDLFLSSTINGSFNAPFFTTRFKEALFHYSALFDMFGSTLSKENPERIRFEREFYGREVMNVIACEGVDRVERPESYKQWQVRMTRAGFKQKHVKPELVEFFREKMKKWGYHKDFVLDEDSNWFLQGWKGRILFSSSCWVPS
ncbi:unnamed protein product [Cochlearia groenlandica]